MNNEGGNAPASPPTEERSYYFVYGTSMPGHLRYSIIEEFVAEAKPARVSGRLYDTGAGYPAAKFGGGQSVIKGFLLRIRPEREFEADRAFTGTEAGLFQAVRVETLSGVEATAFEWAGSTEGMQPIESGVWAGEEA